MTKKDLEKVWMAVMVVLLASTSATWLNPEHKQQSGYSAPWVYPGLAPADQ
jgi:hypothetical protein